MELGGRERLVVMFHWSYLFLILGLLAALLGFSGVVPALAGLARILTLIFAVLFVVSFLVPEVRRPVT
jgi:uncharacterized membrane protein YtjA (UPF0391 family)